MAYRRLRPPNPGFDALLDQLAHLRVQISLLEDEGRLGDEELQELKRQLAELEKQLPTRAY